MVVCEGEAKSYDVRSRREWVGRRRVAGGAHDAQQEEGHGAGHGLGNVGVQGREESEGRIGPTCASMACGREQFRAPQTSRTHILSLSATTPTLPDMHTLGEAVSGTGGLIKSNF